MLELYHYPPSVCSIKARIALEEIGLSYKGNIVNLPKGEHLDPEYIKLNPSAVVPTLVDRGLVVTESSLIIEYLDREFNHSQLMPQERERQVSVRNWLVRTLTIHLAINTLSFSTVYREKSLEKSTLKDIEKALAGTPDPIYRAKRLDLLRNGLDSAYVEQALVQLRRAIGEVEDALADTPWISGHEIGLADIGLVAYFDRLQRIGLEGLWEGKASRLGIWLAEMQSRPSYDAAVTKVLDPDEAAISLEKGSAYWPKIHERWTPSL